MSENTSLYSVEGFKAAVPISVATNAFNVSSRQILTYAIPLLIAYPILVSLLRFRRLRQLHERFNFPTRESLARMTDDQAWEIQKLMAQLEFPFIYVKSLQFALFRVLFCHVVDIYVLY